MVKNKRKVWVTLCVWGAIFLFLFNISNYFQGTKYALINALYECLSNGIVFYITALYLFPKYYKNGRKFFWISFLFISFLSTVLLVIDRTFIWQFRRGNNFDPPPLIMNYFKYFFGLGFTYFVSTSISLMEQTRQLKETEKILTKEKLETELKLLKAQINPHFIFNALNNIYSLTYMQSGNAPDSVLKLSEMLRYVFYDCNKDHVPLSSEIKYIENFTVFQQMKSDFAQNISIETDANVGNIKIAPMLFVPFIENAFKYSRIEEDKNAYVAIEIKQKKGNLFFKIENSIPLNKPTSGSKTGINNVKHRLKIIYPEKHEVNIREKNDNYRVELKIEL